MHVLITGGTGLIGRELCRALLDTGHRVSVLSRRPQTVRPLCGAQVEAWGTLEAWRPSVRIDAIINLAGEPIADRRWSLSQKQRLHESRIGITRELVRHIAQAEHKPKVLLSGSAIGIYGDRSEMNLDEQTPAAGDFAAVLCKQWEAAAQQAAEFGVRTVLLRTGLVLAADGGLLKKMLLPFRMGLGTTLGAGEQWMSWIHMYDYIQIVMRLLLDPTAEGPYNLTAPQPVRHRRFTTELARTLHRPCLLTAPATAMQWILGERSSLVLGGQHVIPSRVTQLGYQFKYPALSPALHALLR